MSFTDSWLLPRSCGSFGLTVVLALAGISFTLASSLGEGPTTLVGPNLCGFTSSFVSYEAKINTQRVWADDPSERLPESEFIYAQMNFTKHFFTVSLQYPTQDEMLTCLFFCNMSTHPNIHEQDTVYLQILDGIRLDNVSTTRTFTQHDQDFTCPNTFPSRGFDLFIPFHNCSLPGVVVYSTPFKDPDASWGRSLYFQYNSFNETTPKPPCQHANIPTFLSCPVNTTDTKNRDLCVRHQALMRPNKPVFGVPPLFTRLGLYVLVAIALAFVGGFVFLIYSAFEGDVPSSREVYEDKLIFRGTELMDVKKQ